MTDAAWVHRTNEPSGDVRTGPEIQAQLRGIIASRNGSWVIGGHEVENAKIEHDAREIGQ